MTTENGSEPIAVIGMSGAFPGADDLEAFWRNLEAGKDCVTEVPAARWDWRAVEDGLGEARGAGHARWGGFLNGLENFDAAFFGLSPREAELIDPQHRLLLMHAWNALENAAYAGSALAGQAVSVIVGTAATGYEARVAESGEPLSGLQATAFVPSVGPNRLSYLLGLAGTSEAVETACSSSLIAVHRGMAELRSGRCIMAIVGGINTLVTPTPFVTFGRAGMLSPSGRCKAFSAHADGYVRGEGVGILVLKRLEAAIADGDPVWAVLRGSAVNHGGRANSLTAPNARSQAEVIKHAILDAGVEVSTIGCVEAHGTGTPLGDPIEISGLSKAYLEIASQQGHTLPIGEQAACAIGSVKTNIGHLELAAGVASLIKIILQMRYGKLVPSLHSEEINPRMRLERTPFRISRTLDDWLRPSHNGKEGLRRAGVSSFGFGGVNAHVIVEEAPPQAGALSACRVQQTVAAVLSANDDTALRRRVRLLIAYLERKPGTDLSALAYTLHLGRDQMEVRLGVIVETVDELIDRLNEFLESGPVPGVHWHADTKADRIRFASFFDDEDVAGLIADCARRRRLEKLLVWWCRGADVPWALLYEEASAARLSLPGYPFSLRRYWLPMQRISFAAPSPVEADTEHTATLRSGGTVVFAFRLREEDPLLGDHRVRGASVLPAAATCAFAYSALDEVSVGTHFSLRDLTWLRLLEIEGVATVRVELSRSEGGYRIKGFCDASSEPLFTCEAVAEAGAGSSEDAEAWATDKGFPDGNVPVGELYESFRRAGIEYGPSYRCVQNLNRNGRSVIGSVTTPKDMVRRHRLEDFVYLLDGALQCLAAFHEPQPGRVCLPARLESLSWSRLIPEELIVRARREESGGFRIYTEDPAGQTIFDCSGFSALPAHDDLGAICYLPRWVSVTTEYPQDRESTGHQDLIWIVDATSREHAERLASEGDEIFGTDELDAMVSRLRGRELGRSIVLALGMAVALEPPADADLGSKAEELLAAAFRVTKELMRTADAAAGLRMYVPTISAASVNGQTNSAVAAGLIGFGSSFAKEMPGWRIGLIDFPSDGFRSMTTDEFRAALAVAEQLRSGEQLLWHRSELYQRRLIPMTLPPGTGFREGGTYLIVGGAGGIGRALTEYLATRYGAQVIWLGRRAVDADMKEAMCRAGGNGPRPVYVQADITDQAALEASLAEIRSIAPCLHGVIHAGMTLKDQTVLRLSEESLLSAATVKMTGAANLATVMQDEALDWMVFFSSLQSLTCAAGQSNYASGCAFMDAFAARLNIKRDYPVLVLNWGYWGEVGAVAGADYSERLQKQGLQPLRPADGFRALERVLASRMPQTVVARFGDGVDDKYGIDRREVAHVLSPPEPVPLETRIPVPGPPEGRQNEVEAHHYLDRLTADWIAEALSGFFGSLTLGRALTAEELVELFEIRPERKRLFLEILNILADMDYLDTDETADRKCYSVRRKWPAPGTAVAAAEGETKPALPAYTALLRAATADLESVLRGQIAPTEVLFPNGSDRLVEPVYRDGPLETHVNTVVASLIEVLSSAHLASGRDRVRIVEVGAGTGGTTAFVLEALAHLGRRVQYVFSDISPSFLERAKVRFASVGAEMTFIRYDLERPLEEQAMAAGEFDILLGANVVHATRDVEQTLKRMKGLLRAGGVLLLSEITAKRHFLTATFGLLDGWWAFGDTDIRIPGSPCVSRSAWSRLLQRCGFTGLQWPLGEFGEEVGQELLLSRSDGIYVAPQVAANDCPERKPLPAKPGNPPQPPTPVRTEPAMAGAGTTDPERQIGQAIAAIVKQTLKLEGALDHDAAFADLGMDSIIAIDMIKRVNETFGCSLNTIVVFDHPTVRRLSRFLTEQGIRVPQPASPQRQAEPGSSQLSGTGPPPNVEVLADRIARGEIEFDAALDLIDPTRSK